MVQCTNVKPYGRVTADVREKARSRRTAGREKVGLETSGANTRLEASWARAPSTSATQTRANLDAPHAAVAGPTPVALARADRTRRHRAGRRRGSGGAHHASPRHEARRWRDVVVLAHPE